MHRSTRGFTLLELLVVIFIISVVLAIFGGVLSLLFFDNPRSTQKRATASMEEWLTETKTSVRRKSCTFDSDGDGLASCTVVTEDGEVIQLQCGSSWKSSIFGVHACKELTFNGAVGTQRR